MKKWIAVVLCALALLGAAGCAAAPKQEAAPAETENQAEAPADKSGEKQAEAPADENGEKQTEAPAEAPAEPPAAEAAEEQQEPPAAEAEGEKERIVGGAFRFTVPSDWQERDDGSYLAVGGSVIISFYAFPFTTDGYSMTGGIKVADSAFPKEFVKLLNAFDRGKYTYDLYGDRATQTESGLDNCFMMINTKDAAGRPSGVIMSAYDWNDEQLFAIMFEHGAIASGYAEDCWRVINSTLERID